MTIPPASDLPEDIREHASRWLARRDRGLTPVEQDEYLDWLRADPRHGRAMAQLDRTWQNLDVLEDWRPKHSTRPNADLLAQPAPRRRFLVPALWTSLAAAAVIAVGGFFLQQHRPRVHSEIASADRAGVKVLPRPERLVLPDGSIVEVNHGGKLESAFTPEERRVRLVRGEAHFTVAKNPARPFVVEAGTVSVRAVGTAFDVRRRTADVEVLVTEGKVHLERANTAGRAFAPTPLVAGERAVVDTVNLQQAPAIATMSVTDIAKALDWQSVRLEFPELPLSEVVAEFNLRNTQQLVIGDAATGALRLGGTFRADNVEAFVRLLEASFGVGIERQPDGTIVLRSAAR